MASSGTQNWRLKTTEELAGTLFIEKCLVCRLWPTPCHLCPGTLGFVKNPGGSLDRLQLNSTAPGFGALNLRRNLADCTIFVATLSSWSRYTLTLCEIPVVSLTVLAADTLSWCPGWRPPPVRRRNFPDGMTRNRQRLFNALFTLEDNCI
jgi:hypothetical protein